MAKGISRKGPHQADFSAGGQSAATEQGFGQPSVGSQSDALTEKEKEAARAAILAGVQSDAKLDEKFMLLVVLAASIATLGLLQGSTAVVIGAMLVSPLMGPIMGIGFGLATVDSHLIRRSLVTLGAGILIAIVVSIIIIWVSPIQDVTDEIRARTQPNLLDLGVAVVGGVAGAYAIMRGLSGVMVGVSIATALVPPLCTVGFGIATGRYDFSMGAMLLFLTNTFAIAFAATIVARVNRYGTSLTPQHSMMQVAGIAITLVILSVPLATSLYNIVKEISARNVVQSTLAKEMDANDKVDSMNVTLDGDRVLVDGVILVDNYDPNLSEKLAKDAGAQLGRPVQVDLVQLRQQSNATEQVVDGFNRRISALEDRDEESDAVAADLMVGNLIPRDDIVIDSQAKLVVVDRNRVDENAEVGKAVDNIILAAQDKHPGWLIRTEALATTAPPAPASPTTAPPAQGQ